MSVETSFPFLITRVETGGLSGSKISNGSVHKLDLIGCPNATSTTARKIERFHANRCHVVDYGFICLSADMGLHQ